MDSRRERLYDSGQAQVYPLPQRDPMRTLADWGAEPTPPEPPYALDDERSYISPGSAPWVSRKRTPGWAQACIVAGVALLLVAAYMAVAVLVARYG